MKRSFILPTILLAIILTGCTDKIKPSVLNSIDSGLLPQQESWNSIITVSDSGRVTAIIHAGYIRVYETSQITYMSKGVRVQFFNPEGQQTSILTSEDGSVDEATNNLEAHTHVVVVSSDSSRMKTEHLMWDNQKQLIYTPKDEFVEITTETDHLYGHGFESDQSLKHYKIFRVTGRSTTQ